MTKKLVILLTVALVLGLALSPAAFAKGKPTPLPGPEVVKSFDGDVYLFATIPAFTTDPWGKISFDLWGGAFKFFFKAANLTPGVKYTLTVADQTLGTFYAAADGTGSLFGPDPLGPSPIVSDIANQFVTLTGGIEPLMSFYPISFKYISPTP